MMEKRRRARINVCLSQLQSLVLDAMKKDTPRYSKLEKADILEMTVKHLRLIQRNHMTAAVNYDPSIVTKYRAGFNECATEVVNYLSQTDGISPQIRTRLLNHLSKCLHTTDSAADVVELVPSHTVTLSSSRQRQTNQATDPPQKEIRTPIRTSQIIPGCLPNGQLAFFMSPNSECSRTVPPCSLAQPLNLSSKQQLELKLEVQDGQVVSGPDNELVKVPEMIWRPW